MNLKSQARVGIVVTSLASAVMATPAAAATAPVAPVDVPLHGLRAVLPMEPPTLRTGVPLPMPGGPMGLTGHGEGTLQPLLLPQFPVTAGLPETLVSASLPDVVESQPLSRALVSAPASDARAITPGAVLGIPLTLPRAETRGLPGVELPRAGVLTPAVTAGLETTLGLARSEP
ncbi:hypothetical protein QWM81_19185 [Streptomyces ficellus]|uniref:Secreted protein n=1 Tax=Streptomyces ficellus TaxID=1977088 RepID=A0ABT7Z9L6_9ACTN|nr:hypothetical protein [Streptomyces ficellus]MDN3296146.1 hypothetical protein [Streptomyces ficellus]